VNELAELVGTLIELLWLWIEVLPFDHLRPALPNLLLGALATKVKQHASMMCII